MIKYVMSLTELDENMKCDKREHFDKIGGHPTYLPPGDIEDYGYFLMEIYNGGPIRGDEDILCWQFYQEDEFGGPISEVVEIHKGAELNIEKKVPVRRWINEYIINYKKIEEEEPDYVDGETFYVSHISMIGGKPIEEILENCEYEGIQYVGVIFERLCPYCDLEFGSSFYVIGFDSDGNLVAI